MSVLELRGVMKTYAGQRAVDAVSLTVPSGEFLTLLGPSGCGKSTTLRMVAGLIPADAGAILIDGRDVTRLTAAARGIGMVFQSLALFPHMTVAENIAFGLKCKGMAARDRQPRVQAALERVRLPGFGPRRPGQLSGGQRQRVALARAIVTDPNLLLLDEPFSALDRKLRDEMQEELREIVRAVGITTLFVTHDQEEAIRLSDRIAVMQGGRVVQVDRPRALYERPGTRFVAEFMGSPNVLPIRTGGCPAALDGTLIEMDMPEQPGPGEARLLLNVRPEHIRLQSHRPEHGPSMAGRVLSSVYEGAFTTTRVAPHGDPSSPWTVRESTGAADGRVAGATVFLSWDRGHSHFIREHSA